MKDGTEEFHRRLGAIRRLLARSPNATLGRTAVVKLLFLLQAVRRVDLGYDFRLYTYGPFDAEVLNDLESGRTLRALEIKAVGYPSGYGYEIRARKEADDESAAAEWLAAHEADFAWVADHFAPRSASELELLATIVYVHGELSRAPSSVSHVALARRVGSVKPKYPESYILAKCAELRELGVVSASG